MAQAMNAVKLSYKSLHGPALAGFQDISAQSEPFVLGSNDPLSYSWIR
jgi:hypothetical protein